MRASELIKGELWQTSHELESRDTNPNLGTLTPTLQVTDRRADTSLVMLPLVRFTLVRYPLVRFMLVRSTSMTSSQD